jgi:hypothetical protein
MENLTNKELERAVELLVHPADLRNRRVMEAILKALSFTPADVKRQIKIGKQLHSGPAFRF